jgi:hypothetical protein
VAGRRRPARLPHRRRLTRRAAPGAGDSWAALGAVRREYLVPHTAPLAVRRRLSEDPELAAYARTAHEHIAVALDGWARQCPGDPFATALAAQGAAAVLGSACTTWQPDDDPTAFLDLVGRGFALARVTLGR